MTVREVAGIMGCCPHTAGNLLRYLQKPFRRLPPCPADQHHEHAGPDLDSAEREGARLMRARSYDPPIIRPPPFARLSRPHLGHTAGGPSQGERTRVG